MGHQRTHTYNARAVKMSLGGVPLEDGLAEDTFVTISRMTEAFTSVASVTGSVSRSRTNDDRGEVVVSFLHNSVECKKLQDRMNLDMKSQNGIPPAPFFLRDMISGDEFYAAEAWISNRDTIERGRETGTQSFTITCSRLEVDFGGL